MRVKRFLKDSKRYAVIPFILTVNLLAQLWSILQLQDAKCGSVDDQFTSQCRSHNKNSFWLESNIYNVQLLWTIKMQTKINECPASDISDLCPQMDLNVSICSNSWSYFFMISFYMSFTNVYLHIQFSMTMWINFTMQHELGWITIEFHNCQVNNRDLYSFLFSHSSIFYAFKQPWKEWPTSILHFLECISTIIRSTSETNANDSKNPHTHNLSPWFQTKTLFRLHI